MSLMIKMKGMCVTLVPFLQLFILSELKLPINVNELVDVFRSPNFVFICLCFLFVVFNTAVLFIRIAMFFFIFNDFWFYLSLLLSALLILWLSWINFWINFVDFLFFPLFLFPVFVCDTVKCWVIKKCKLCLLFLCKIIL